MKVFISWSGERSKKVAELLDEWIQCVIQAVDPFLSSKDIDRGSLWFTEISEQLSTSSIGIVCLTKENKNKPWILFESGALAKGLNSNKVCTFLVDLVSTDVQDPLAQFNHTLPNADSVWELIKTINKSLTDKKLNEAILKNVFNTYWPQFEDKFNNILKSTPEDSNLEVRDEKDIMTDVLSTVRNLDRRLRNFENKNSIIQFGIFKEDDNSVKEEIKSLFNEGHTRRQIFSELITKYGISEARLTKYWREVIDELNIELL